MQHQKQKLQGLIQESYLVSEELASHKDKDFNGILKKLPIESSLITQSDIDYLKKCGMKISSYSKKSEDSRLIATHKNQLNHVIIDNFSKIIAIEKINFEQRLEDNLTQPLHSKSVAEKYPKFFNCIKMSLNSVVAIGTAFLGVTFTFPALTDYVLSNPGPQMFIAATAAAAFATSIQVMFSDPSKKIEVMNTLADKFSRTTYIDNEPTQACLENLEKHSLPDKIGALRAKNSAATLAPGLTPSQF